MKTIARTLVLALAVVCSGCMVVKHDPAPSHPSNAAAKKTVYVCTVCGKQKSTAGASGKAPACHGRKMVPR